MYPNLIAQKIVHNLNDTGMASIIGVTRNTYAHKMKSGKFSVDECREYCKYFGQSFEYLFTTAGEIKKSR